MLYHSYTAVIFIIIREEIRGWGCKLDCGSQSDYRDAFNKVSPSHSKHCICLFACLTNTIISSSFEKYYSKQKLQILLKLLY